MYQSRKADRQSPGEWIRQERQPHPPRRCQP
jgi:hypothetical protein